MPDEIEVTVTVEMEADEYKELVSGPKQDLLEH